ncbi:hypothetical protein OROMI_006394 [Orobanche minor]
MVEVKEEQVYLQQCLVAFVEGVVAVIPKWLEDVIDAVRKGRGVAALTGSTSKTNPPPFQVVLNLLGSSWFKHKVVNAEVLKQLAVLIKLVEPPFQGTDDFQASVVAVLAIFTSYLSFIQQNRKIFVRTILPSASIICQKSENGKTRFFCFKLWFQVVVTLLNESSLPHKKKELKQMCNDHFHPLHTRLMTDEDSMPIFANKLWELLVESDII